MLQEQRPPQPGAASSVKATPTSESRSSLRQRRRLQLDDSPLTLHDFRKSQHSLGPASPAPLPRQIRRKAASSSLQPAGSTENVQTSSSPPVRYSLSRSPLWQHTLDSPHARPAPSPPTNPFSFASVFKSHHTRQYYPVPLDAPSNASTLGTSESEDSARGTPAGRLHGGPASFRPIKHLPIRSSPFVDPIDTSGSVSPSSPESPGPTTAGFSNASNISLSHFPRPPVFDESSPLEPSESSPQSRDPRTPTTYHLRGASFDIINPHPSLCLYKIETPGEPDTERLEYFLPPRSCTMADEPPDDLHASAVTPLLPAFSSLKARSTPPRSIFDDLPSAYSKIRGRTTPSEPRSPVTEMPLPPVPVQTRESRSDAGRVALEENAELQSNLRPVSSFSRPISFRSRLSQVFRLRRADGNDELELQGTGANRPVLRGQTSSSTKKPSKTQNISSQDLLHAQVSEASLAISHHYYDDESLFGTNTPSRNDSASLYPAGLRVNRDSTPVGHSVPQEISNGALIDLYRDDASNATISHRLSALSSMRSEQQISAAAHFRIPQADSTIGNLLEDYHRQDDSCTVPTEFLSERSIQRSPSKQQTARLSQFDFELNPISDPDEKALKANHDASQDIRHATARALGLSPRGSPPTDLPADPSLRCLGVNAVAKDAALNISINSDSQTGAASYENTSNLLYLSSDSPSVEVGRGTNLSRIPHRSKSAGPQLHTQVSSSPHSDQKQPSPPRGTRISTRRSLDIDEMMNRDVKHLSAMSGLSDLQGSVYVMYPPSVVNEQQDASRGETPALPPRSALREQLAVPARSSKTMLDRSSFAPVAAFSPSSVFPGSQRFPPSPHDQVTMENHDPHGTGYRDDDEHDWETLPDSRPFFGEIPSDSGSYAGLSNDTSSSDPAVHQSVNTHYRQAYRTLAPATTHQPLSVPEGNERSRIALPPPHDPVPPLPPLYTYSHPSPLPRFLDNPFTSSPPQITGPSFQEASRVTPEPIWSRQPTPEAPNQDLPAYAWQRANLSVVYEASGEASDPNNPGAFQRSIETHTTSNLSAEPGPELSGTIRHFPTSDEQQRTSSRSTRSTNLSNDLVTRLREGDARMADEPLSRNNSFAKLSTLGPHANITGTPNGTNMRVVGSSVVGSSSPFVSGSSSPLVSINSSPHSKFTASPAIPWSRSSRSTSNSARSPCSDYDSRRLGSRSMDPSWDPPKDSIEFRQNMLDASGRASYLQRTSDGQGDPRASVATQKSLRQIQLLRNSNAHFSRNLPRFPRPTDAQRRERPVVNSGGPLLPFTLERQSTPHLRRRQVTPSSLAFATAGEKRITSTIAFFACLLLPPVLILYAYGWLDGTIAWFTSGRIEHFGARQKRWAKWVGWPLNVFIVLFPTIFWIVITHVPNNYPRTR